MQHQTHTATAGVNAGGGAGTPREPSLMLNVNDVATMLRCSARHVWRMADAGKMPRPHKIGALCRWERAAIQQWVAAGCPNCRSTGSRQAGREGR